jgi:hypothetical protein
VKPVAGFYSAGTSNKIAEAVDWFDIGHDYSSGDQFLWWWDKGELKVFDAKKEPDVTHDEIMGAGGELWRGRFDKRKKAASILYPTDSNPLRPPPRPIVNAVKNKFRPQDIFVFNTRVYKGGVPLDEVPELLTTAHSALAGMADSVLSGADIRILLEQIPRMTSFDIRTWRYGNYCGPGPGVSSPRCNSVGDKPLPEPENETDRACMLHDIDYCFCDADWKNAFTGGTSCSRNADKKFVDRLKAVRKFAHGEQAANSIIRNYFDFVRRFRPAEKETT